MVNVRETLARAERVVPIMINDRNITRVARILDERVFNPYSRWRTDENTKKRRREALEKAALVLQEVQRILAEKDCPIAETAESKPAGENCDMIRRR